jgi:hypothetical protein
MLEAAERHLPRAELEAILPDRLLFWDAFEYREEVKLAVGRETIHKNPYDEELSLGSGTVPPPSARMIYGEWDHPEHVGFATAVIQRLGLISDTPRCTSHTCFLESAPR